MSTRDALPVQLQTRSNDLINILDNYRNDEYCATLLILFVAKHPQTLGFNEIRRQLPEMTDKVNPSPNALEKHLGHLMENKVIQRREDKESKLKIKPVIYSLTSEFIELGKNLFITNRGLDVEQLKGELTLMSISEASRSVTYILLNDTLDSVKDALTLDSKIADFKRLLKSARLKVVLDAYSMVVKNSGSMEEALSVLLGVNKRLSDFTGFNDAVS
jgi:hypothetical protein